MKKVIFALALFILAPTFISLIFGMKNAPVTKEGSPMVFLGRRNLNSQDTATYYSFIEQAKQGKILFENLYTTETPNPSFFRPSYLLIGNFARLFNLSPPVAFHFARIPLGILFFAAVYFLFSFFIKKKSHIFLALTILAFSSGLGFILGGTMPQSSDLWIPESNTFLSLSDSPHFIFSQTLMILIFASFLWLLKTNDKRLLFLGGLSSALLAFEHPFDLPIIALTFILFIATFLLSENRVPKKYLLTSFILLIPSLFGIINYYFLLNAPAISSWSNQNVMLSPDILNYIVGLGILIPLAFLGLIHLLKSNNQDIKEFGSFLLLSWILATAILLYAPVVFQRRFIEGIHIPLSLLAAFGIIFLSETFEDFIKLYQSKSKHKAKTQFPGVFRYMIAFIIIVILSLTNVKSIISDLQIFSKDKADDYYYYILPQETEAFSWIEKNMPEDKIILSSWFYGNLIPGFTGHKVYLGHKVQTIDFEKKNSFMYSFFKDLSDKERLQFLKEQKIDYLFFGKDDYFLRLGNFKPDSKDYLKNVYENKGVSIYKTI